MNLMNHKQIEALVSECFSRVLKKEIPENADFFAIGGDELQALQLAEMLERRSGCRFDPALIFEEKTPLRIASAMLEKGQEGAVPSGIIKSEYPLTSVQRGVYLDCKMRPDSTEYNEPFYVALPEKTDIGRLIEALKRVCAAHPALFCTFHTEGGEPVMRTHQGEIEVAVYDTDRFGDFLRPFDLEKGPLYRFEICQREGKRYLLMDVHHLVADGTTFSVLFRQLTEAYGGKPVKGETITLFDQTEFEQKYPNKEAEKRSLAFFENLFAGSEETGELLPDIGKLNPPSGSDSVYISSPDGLDSAQVRAFAKSQGVTVATLFTAAFSLALSAFSGSENVCFTSGSAGRHNDDLSLTGGMFVRVLPLWFALQPGCSVRDFVRRVQRDFASARLNDQASLGEILRRLDRQIDCSFVYQGSLFGGLELEGEAVYPVLFPDFDCSSRLICHVMEQRGGWQIRMHYRKNVYSAALMQSLAETVFAAVKGLMEQEKLGDIPFGGAHPNFEGIRLMLDEEITVGQMFLQAAQAFPDKEALIFENARYTYADALHGAGRIAAYIRSLGLGAEDFVGILSPRNDKAVLSAWGAVLAGAAFEMLDMGYPAERLSYMVQDTGAKLLIADRSLTHLLPDFAGQILYTDELDSLPECPDIQALDAPNHALCVIYTSGTTGQPKGVVWENRNMTALIENHRRTFHLTSAGRIASYASFGFDAGTLDVLSAFMLGAVLCIVPDEIRLDLPLVEKFFCDQGITHAIMTTQVGRMLALQTKCKTLQFIMVGGEKLVPFEPQKGFTFLNAYGPCETAVYVTSHAVSDADSLQPVGLPCPNVQVYILDGQGRNLPDGAVGELCIATPQMSRGYLNLPEKTQSVFIPNPFCREKGFERLYKTGDMARILPDGQVDLLGRRDGQVKIRGFRVELTEIEEVIRRFHGISDATVCALTDPAGGKYIAAYVVSEKAVDIPALRAFISAEKPPYMVPRAFMQLDAIPYTRNNKVDKRALPVPTISQDAIALPENEQQKQILACVCAILGSDSIGIDNDLFDLGLTSIGALRLNAELGQAFAVPLKISDVMQNPTVRRLSDKISSLSPAVPAQMQTDYPLMDNQLGIFVECGPGQQTTRYNMPALLLISDEIDTKRLQKAVQAAINAHPYLKSRLKTDERGEVFLQRADDAEAFVQILSLPSLPDDLIHPFDLLSDALYRAQIYETKKGNYLLLDVHHILADGVSLGILLEDISAIYAGKTVEKEGFSGFEKALEEQNHQKNPAETKAYFDSLLSGADCDCLPAPCPEESQSRVGHYTLSMDHSAPVLSYCKQHHLSPAALMNAAFSYTLCRFLHKEDVCYASVYSGRDDSRLARACAMLVQTLPVRGTIDWNKKPLDFALDMQKQWLETISKQGVSFAALCRDWGLNADLFFNYQGEGFGFDSLCGKKAQSIPLTLSDAKAPLSIEIYLEQETFKASVTYKTELYCADFAQSLTKALFTAAHGFIKEEKLSDIGLLQDKSFYDALNDNEVQVEFAPAQRDFEDYAGAHPDQIAAKTASEAITFGEMNEQANRIANGLLALGVQANDIVGLLSGRSVLVPVMEWGVLKSGGAFLNMLPEYPDERLDYCLQDSGCKIVLAPGALIAQRPDLFAPDKPYKAYALEEMLKYQAEQPPVTISPHDLCYCIYTSGSTGRPKGVLLEHHNERNFLRTSPLRKQIQQGNTILCTASISFDMSLSEMLLPLSMGKSLYIASDEEIHDFDALRRGMLDNGVDLLMMTPSFAWSLLGTGNFDEVFARIQGITLGAEAFPKGLYDRLKQLNPRMLIQNGYGPTECTQACSCKVMTDGNDITIGRPAPNMGYYIRDDQGHLMPKYALGELCVTGEGVCRGYKNLPEKNQEAFTQIGGIRAYRTGDLARLRGDLEAEFTGRKDDQVKLRGFRVELGEIEQVMAQYPSVSQCKVVLRNQGAEDFLAGYFTAKEKIDLTALTAFMKEKLTYYMVPQALMQLDKMPMTPNGKLDKKALPDVVTSTRRQGKKQPKKSLEEIITSLIKDILGIAECYADDNFFDLGGTSLSASKVVMQLKSKGWKIEYQDIFDHQTPEELAEYLESISAPAKGDDADDAAGHPDEISEVLRFNSVEYTDLTKRDSLGCVLLTGATGFLGCHVLKALLEEEKGEILCLIRGKNPADALVRLKTTFVYYFEDECADLFEKRVRIVPGNITDDNIIENLGKLSFDTLINCAACVKHYASDNSIEQVNVVGAGNMIELSRAKNARFVQVSTVSIPGAHTEETYRRNIKMAENELFVIQDMNNQYIRSKYQAELLTFQAIKQGLRGKIIRVGNLMGRYSDGEFQINMRTNAFMNALRGFVAIGKCPMSHCTDPMSFSPVDCAAKSIVLLAGTNDCFTAFHAQPRYPFDEMYVIEAANRCGLTVKPVPDKEYYDDFYRMMGDNEKSEKVSALLTNDRPDLHMVDTENRFTTNVLYRLGFSWPLIDQSYLVRVLHGMDELGFFE